MQGGYVRHVGIVIIILLSLVRSVELSERESIRRDRELGTRGI